MSKLNDTGVFFGVLMTIENFSNFDIFLHELFFFDINKCISLLSSSHGKNMLLLEKIIISE